MELIFIGLLLLLFLIIAPIVALVRSSRLSREMEDLQFKLRSAETELLKVRRLVETLQKPETPPTEFTAPPPAEETIPAPHLEQVVSHPPIISPVAEQTKSAPEVPPLFPATEPPLLAKISETLPPLSQPPTPFKTPAINWEQFMGVKLFAWIGGLALFIGVALFLKYSFEHDLVPPVLRATIGFVAGFGLVIGGVLLSNKKYTVTSHTLCATGVVILYAVTFACHSVYHFALFGQISTFLLMALITATAFLLAVRMNAIVVAVLGMLGGFLTPVLLSTGQDNPFGLFAYIALLDAGLIAVALHRRWHFLTLAGALGTVIMQIGWTAKFFEVGKVYVALGIFGTFNLLFLAAFYLANRLGRLSDWMKGASLLIFFFTFAFAFYLMSVPALGLRPGTIFAFVLLADLCVVAVVLLHAKMISAHMVSGAFAFVLLTIWTMRFLNTSLLFWALGLYLLFAILHSVFPIVLQRSRPGTAPTWCAHLFPPLALLLVMLPILNLPELSFLVWICVLLVNLLAIGIAIVTASLFAIFAVLLLTLFSMALWIFKIPSELTLLPESLFLIGGFAIFFFAAGIFASRKILAKWNEEPKQATPSMFSFLENRETTMALLPAFSAILPFLLLMMVSMKLPMTNPFPLFGLALLLIVLVLGVAHALRQDFLAPVGLASVLALEYLWHLDHFRPETGAGPLGWYLVFTFIFGLFPFAFHKRFADLPITWATAALSAPLHFFLVHQTVSALYPNNFMGLLPAVFAIPPLLGLVFLLRKVPADNPIKLSQLAWFGGVTLFFITLIFPIQFEREWITLGWALEGAALLWLFHRVPHPGLRIVGIGLLLIAFVRLALNPAVLEYHPRTETPILNWYLYAYLVAAASMFAGARFLAAPRDIVFGKKVTPLLYSLGTILLFLLVNIQIADYFSDGRTLTFQFSGNFARDMTYTIAWALFAFALLLIGILKRVPGVRYAAVGLLSLTLLKLFFHDLAHLKQLYRIGALISVAVIAMLASFIYQKFLSSNPVEEKE
ncbi:MAG: DUF2339 domain-containing protein [Verrucomicrobia bacterium]|nr:DUF2339 domain-containing protein [Verrucomicrobiota bacterium]